MKPHSEVPFFSKIICCGLPCCISLGLSQGTFGFHRGHTFFFVKPAFFVLERSLDSNVLDRSRGSWAQTQVWSKEKLRPPELKDDLEPCQ